MKVTRMNAQWLRVLPESPHEFDPKYLLNWRRRRGESFYVIEDNYVNRIVLGLTIPSTEHCQLQDTAGLLPYQITDLHRLNKYPAMLNANPMGLGKTPETLMLLKNLQVDSIVIVCPKIIRIQWQRQCKRWLEREATIYEKGMNVKPGIWIINYDKLRDERTLMQFNKFRWDCIVVDEAHKIKNPKSLQSKAVNSIPARYKYALTGTPILKYVDDLWGVLHFLNPEYCGSSSRAWTQYFGKFVYNGYTQVLQGLTQIPERIAILNALLSRVAIRNEAVEVAHGKSRETISLQMSKEQAKMYTDARNLLLDALPEDCTVANGAILTLRLRQITSWPGLYIEEEAGPKFEWILETCKNNPTEKLVVFSVFERTVSALKSYLHKHSVQCATITGRKSSVDNEQSRLDFVEGDAQVLAGTIGAMGQGYDGLQSVSRILIFIDRDWSPEIVAQAEDRLHRMGQEHPVHIYYLECIGTIDRHVARITESRAEDIRTALTREVEDE